MWCWEHRYLISQHPEVEAKVLAELESLQLMASPQLPSPRPLEYADLSKLTYLSCCIKVRVSYYLVATSGSVELKMHALSSVMAVPAGRGCRADANEASWLHATV